MSRLHDMGGRFGDGPVDAEPADAPVFAEEWHARALAVTLAAGSLGLWTLDASRHSRERLLPADYAVFSYYEKWISALCNMLVEHDVISRAELESAMADSEPSPLQARRLAPDKVAKVLSSGGPTERKSGEKARFSIGDAVRAAGRRRSSAKRGDVGRAARRRGGEPGGVGRRDAVAVDGFGRGEGIRVDGEEHVVGDDVGVRGVGRRRIRRDVDGSKERRGGGGERSRARAVDLALEARAGTRGVSRRRGRDRQGRDVVVSRGDVLVRGDGARDDVRGSGFVRKARDFRRRGRRGGESV